MDRLTRPPAYLDHTATSPLRPEAAAAMAPYLDGRFGNPSGSHRVAREARRQLDDARDQIAAVLGADPGGLVFTSGGTEADNLAVLGALAARRQGEPAGQPLALVCSAVEHAAVLEPARAAARASAGGPVELRQIPVDARGRVVVDALKARLGPDVALVSVMAANSEVGTVQPLAEVAEAVRRWAPPAVLHTDAVQAAGVLDVAALAAGYDLVSVSAHKLGGPPGIGALAVRPGTALQPILFGGGQERERRSGTPSVAAAVGFAAALEAAAADRPGAAERIGALRDRLAAGIEAMTGTPPTVPAGLTLPGHCHVCFEGVEREELLVLLDDAGVCASAGPACASGALETSAVLAAMGVAPGRAAGAVRFTLGWTSTDADVDAVLAALPTVLDRLGS